MAVLRHGRLHRYNTAPGEIAETALLEEEFAALMGAKYCLAVASGGYAMGCALRALGLQPGEPVLTNAFTLAPVPGAIAAAGGSPVFIDFTAEWCLTCKVNEKTILNTSGIRTSMADNGVIPLKAGWTNKDETITTWLQRYGKAGVPFYLVIPADPDKAPIPLPEVITPALVKETLAKAAG